MFRIGGIAYSQITSSPSLIQARPSVAPTARCADEQGFPSWIRPGDRPPVQRSNNRPLMWNCCRQLKDRQGQLGAGIRARADRTSRRQARGMLHWARAAYPRRRTSNAPAHLAENPLYPADCARASWLGRDGLRGRHQPSSRGFPGSAPNSAAMETTRV